MVFCGQCGLGMNAGTTQCPRCGTLVEPGASVSPSQGDDVQSDTPTMASPSLLGQMDIKPSAIPEIGANPQKLVLHPEQNTELSNYATPDAYEATRRVELPEQGYGPALPGTPSNPNTGSVYPSASQPPPYSQQQSNSNYPPYDMYAQYPQSGSNYAPQGEPAYPGFAQPQGYQPQSDQVARTASQASRGRTTALLLILFGLLLILVAMTLLILEKNNVLGDIFFFYI